MPLKVTVEERGEGAYAIHPVGSIDSNTHTILLAEVEKVLKNNPTLLIFNMADVDYVSSAGISVVLTSEKSLKLQGGTVLMVNVQPQIKKVFNIVQALPPERIFSSVQEMDAYLKEIQRKVKAGEM